MRHQDSPVGSILTPALTSRDMPGIADHQLEVVITVNRRAEVSIVALELLPRDDLIAIFTHLKRQ